MKANQRIILLSLVFIMVAATPLAAVETPIPQFRQALGVQVGQLSGFGLSYQQWNGITGYQIAAGAMYHPLMDNGSNLLNYVIGVEFQNSVYMDDFSNWLTGRLYLFTGVNHRGFIESIDTNPAIDITEYAPGDFNAEFGAGGGIGVEAIFFEHFAVATEMAIMVAWNPTRALVLEQFAVDIGPQLSLRYRY
ncbi:MAG: hypothetical protein CVV52_09235 [Spirochaetae bacterium HGW-Spirochaetae-8]|jgi:hypothetical protein|nr:MAG: hypothetical protein CVV52_09235 [Spirochaetae bacterium HGW-Spirochaetae-8]